MSLDYYRNDNRKDWGYSFFKWAFIKWAFIVGSITLVVGFGVFIYKDLTGGLPICRCQDVKTS